MMENYNKLILELLKLPKETEWLEFKHNNDKPDEIGEYISALSNSATYASKDVAYMIWGVDNQAHSIIGTSFDYTKAKIGNEELENWLHRMLSENANFSFHSVEIDNFALVLLIIYRATSRTVRFKNVDYIRVGSYKKPLKEYPAIETELWRKLNTANYESSLAKKDLQTRDVLNLLDYTTYFDLTNIVLPSETDKIIHYLLEDGLVVVQDDSLYAITNLGVVLFAKKLAAFNGIVRKSVRVIQYKGINKVETIREDTGAKGYASGFEGLLKYTIGLLPAREEVENGLRKNVSVYPEIALRELIANALIHQDLSITGTGPTIELFDNRIEITNPGTPLVDYMRFIDNPPRSRNETLASLMRRMGICEERGSGWDKIALSCEVAQLPAPKIEVYKEHTKITIYSYVPFGSIRQEEKIWACYIHACLKQASGEQLTNASLRDRFGVPESNKSAISRLIATVVDKGLIKPLDPEVKAHRYSSYVPFWA